MTGNVSLAKEILEPMKQTMEARKYKYQLKRALGRALKSDHFRDFIGLIPNEEATTVAMEMSGEAIGNGNYEYLYWVRRLGIKLVPITPNSLGTALLNGKMEFLKKFFSAFPIRHSLPVKTGTSSTIFNFVCKSCSIANGEYFLRKGFRMPKKLHLSWLIQGVTSYEVDYKAFAKWLVDHGVTFVPLPLVSFLEIFAQSDVVTGDLLELSAKLVEITDLTHLTEIHTVWMNITRILRICDVSALIWLSKQFPDLQISQLSLGYNFDSRPSVLRQFLEWDPKRSISHWFVSNLVKYGELDNLQILLDYVPEALASLTNDFHQIDNDFLDPCFLVGMQWMKDHGFDLTEVMGAHVRETMANEGSACIRRFEFLCRNNYFKDVDPYAIVDERLKKILICSRAGHITH
jgi:hypothetical protein